MLKLSITISCDRLVFSLKKTPFNNVKGVFEFYWLSLFRAFIWM